MTDVDPRGPERPVVSVRAFIRDARGRVLILRRSAASLAGNRWCLPGGKVDYGETVEEALHKEVHEETGLECRAIRFLFYQDSLPTEPGGMHCVNLYFACAIEGKVELNDESSEHAWIGRAELDSYDLAFRAPDAIRTYWTQVILDDSRDPHQDSRS